MEEEEGGGGEEIKGGRQFETGGNSHSDVVMVVTVWTPVGIHGMGLRGPAKQIE